MQSSDHERLLRDVLAEGDYQKFKKELLRKTTAEFRRVHRRRVWFVPWALAASVTIAGCAWYLFTPRAVQQPATQAHLREAAPERAWIVRTRTPRDRLFVRSSSATNFIVSSGPSRVVSVNSSPESLAVIPTSEAEHLAVTTDGHSLPPLISDQELFRLFADRPAGFVQGRDGQKQFVLLAAPSRETSEGQR
jgi:hypothetical protein